MGGGARAGLPPALHDLRIILPQGLRRALPATANIFISLLKDSSLLSVIAVPELTYQAQTQAAQSFGRLSSTRRWLLPTSS